MPKLLQPLLAAVITCSLATPALANPYGHGFRHMAQVTAQDPTTPPPSSEVQPAPAPAPAPIAQPYPAQPYAQPQPQPYYGPQPYPPQPAPAYEQPRGRRKGMMIGGWTMLGASYLLTAVTGAVLADACPNDRPCDRVGYYMMIPVAGPFIAIGPSQSATGSAFLGLSGLVQTAGLILGIVGTAQFVADGRQQQTVLNNDGFRLTRNLRANINSRAAGAVLGLHYRF